MARIQLALNVDDLEEAIPFYEQLFGVAPHKVRDGYANFAVTDPPLKLVLFEAPGASQTLNHLGVEVEDTTEVADAAARLAAAGMHVDVRDQETCCHATQDKVWVDGPGAHRWEVYTITDDLPLMTEPTAGTSACCA
jgi:catechol 2,3-dioxygenase-like lactoylglutathione lyase family enzyme